MRIKSFISSLFATFLVSGFFLTQSYAGGIVPGCSFQEAKNGNCKKQVPLENGCPEGYYVSGDYCLAEDYDKEQQEIPKYVCPEGFDRLGSKCVRPDSPS